MKILALTGEDVDIISAHVQDMVIDRTAMQYSRHNRQFSLAGDRFCHEDMFNISARLMRRYRRTDSLVQIHHVKAVRMKDARSSAAGPLADDEMAPKEDMLTLLAIRFVPADPDGKSGDPGGQIYLYFANGAELCVDVECPEVSLTDQGTPRRTPVRPLHL